MTTLFHSKLGSLCPNWELLLSANYSERTEGDIFVHRHMTITRLHCHLELTTLRGRKQLNFIFIEVKKKYGALQMSKKESNKLVLF